jgi:galactokinase
MNVATLIELYGEEGLETASGRFQKLIDSFPDQTVKPENLNFFVASGRVEILGNHTDHQNGKVIAASVSQDIVAAVATRNDQKIVFHSTGFKPVVVELNDLKSRESEQNTTVAIVRGVAALFNQMGAEKTGLTIHANSTVLVGSGLSSSAAVEVLLSKIYSYYNFSDQLDNLELAQLSQIVENQYFGKPSGLMDQAASAIGGLVGIDFYDPDHPGVIPMDLNLHAIQYDLCTVSLNAGHHDLTSEYAAIPQEMRAVAKLLQCEVLSQTSKMEVIMNAKLIRQKIGDRAFLRALHFFDEDENVTYILHRYSEHNLRGAELAKSILYEISRSGYQSSILLQNVSVSGQPKQQAAAVALALSAEFSENDQSRPTYQRIHGGGFGGTILVAVPQERFLAYQKFMEPVFGKNSVTKLRVRNVGTAKLNLY